MSKPQERRISTNNLTMEELKSLLLTLGVDEKVIDGLSFHHRKKFFRELIVRDDLLHEPVEKKLRAIVEEAIDTKTNLIEPPWQVPLESRIPSCLIPS